MKYTCLYNSDINSENKSELRVLTLNACLLPHYIFQSNGDDNREQRAMLIHQMVQKYDIVLLQETFGTFWCNSWRNIFKNVPNMTSLLTIKRHGFVDSGLIILSKYPVIDRLFIPFKKKPLSNKIIDRGFLYCCLKVGDKKVHVINTHLSANEGHIGDKPPSSYREAQINQIMEFKNKLDKENDVWIIGGDFNDDNIAKRTFDETYSISMSENPEDTVHRILPFCMDHEYHQGCIDYIVSNRQQNYSIVLKNLISDHYPVESEIVII